MPDGPTCLNVTGPNKPCGFLGHHEDCPLYVDPMYVKPGPDPERDRRRQIYHDRERRRAARALDRYIEVIIGDAARPSALTEHRAVSVAGDRFVEAVGDYVLSRLHHNGDYGVSPDLPEVAGHMHAWPAGPVCVCDTPAGLSACPVHGRYGASEDNWCDCDWLGAGTPRHAPSSLCKSLRPNGPRQEGGEL